MQLSKQDLENASGKVYDTLIVGGGAGGLSAGVYLQRFRLSSVIVDKGKARSFWIREVKKTTGGALKFLSPLQATGHYGIFPTDRTTALQFGRPKGRGIKPSRD